jgi:hypothetical protein
MKMNYELQLDTPITSQEEYYAVSQSFAAV